MRETVARLSLVLCVAMCCALLAPAQSGRMRGRTGASQDPNDETLRLVVEEVLLPVSVQSDEKLTPALTASDFIVLEDGKRQQINSVMRTSSNVLLVLDTSGNAGLHKNINLNRELAFKLIDALTGEDRAAILTYADKINLICDWTDSKEELRQSLDWKFRPGLKSRFFESLVYAGNDVLTKVNGRRSVILVTDGTESFKDHQFAGALAAFHKARATVYVVSHTGMLLSKLRPQAYNKLSWYEMLDPGRRSMIQQLRRLVMELEAAETNLKQIALETGGWMWNPIDREEFMVLTKFIVGEIDLEYIVAYSAKHAAEDEEFHTVNVLTTRPGLTVRSRRGIYFHGPVNPTQPTRSTDNIK